MDTENPYFRVFTEGIFQAETVTAEIVPSTRKLTENLQAQLDERWSDYQGKKWPNDENPSRFRYEGYEVVDGVVKLKVAPSISYKDSITWGPDLTQQYGQDAAPLPLMVSSLIETSDGKIVIGKRNGRADYKAGGLSGMGGAINIKEDTRPDGTLDILHALGREIEEESGVKLQEIKPTLHGIIYNPVSGTVNLGFVVTTSLSSDEIKKRPHDDENELLFIDIDPDTVQNLVLTRVNAFTTETLELLMSVGEQKFGKRWASETREIFRLRQISYAEAIKRGPSVVKKLEERDIKK
ncbi:hypothetical protein A2803_05250 [Candidatus Woesebacteria bacterium RIFCSPHIGHO2_01_FULL_44_21]|uniref:Nudix hydrolase domain-containing protein n=1 Tax=Candidatus Woesebacteria bacterium RIFCSPHIGHO2_01_FULL_44_21 TaxID=1802503 RepID=A0A1F7YW01_9BACT|nr:MAG: hypothetical protein A2803_05250 [Candidatus Woesebacteria bacterium RIFCSPHIGHO2_01_FULL_44_21]OGM69075.1 MAG: hypothetical protein A2897_04565 [Candidatus Woesebacteria bacterium RIFCSPLOWO2_01_FULL_44_24b]